MFYQKYIGTYILVVLCIRAARLLLQFQGRLGSQYVAGLPVIRGGGNGIHYQHYHALHIFTPPQTNNIWHLYAAFL